MTRRPPSSSSVLALLALLAALWAVCVGLGGCGYAPGELYDPDIRTVAVPIFENRTPYRGLERDLTEALAKNIELRTPYKVVAAGQAQTLLTGTVVAVEQVALSQTSDGGLPQEMEVRLYVDLTWKNLRTGKTLRERKGLPAVGGYIPTRPLGQAFPTGQHQAVSRMADQIVRLMQSDW